MDVTGAVSSAELIAIALYAAAVLALMGRVARWLERRPTPCQP